ncbi:Hypothetical predicted protein [Paramuricea clavata]|uniref:Uncharacterized protein n=1 Tax=Paramuricea clavata TaxID=317549 RepID=A0A6S7I2U1_PARCT|nr:Hypothetical predicted protein [Paramuricea clavata]
MNQKWQHAIIHRWFCPSHNEDGLANMYIHSDHDDHSDYHIDIDEMMITFLHNDVLYSDVRTYVYMGKHEFIKDSINIEKVELGRDYGPVKYSVKPTTYSILGGRNNNDYDYVIMGSQKEEDEIKPYFEEDRDLIDCLLITYDVTGWALHTTNIFLRDEIYTLKFFVFLSEIKSDVDLTLGVASSGTLTFYRVDLIYSETRIRVRFEHDDYLAYWMTTYLNIELDFTTDDNNRYDSYINMYDSYKKILYSNLLMEYFWTMFSSKKSVARDEPN